MAIFRQANAATQIQEPAIARFFFSDTRIAALWMLIRIYVGFQWLTAGIEKMFAFNITPGADFGPVAKASSWVFGDQAGTQIKGFLLGAVKQSTGAHPSVQGWYASFLSNVAIPHSQLFAYLVTFGETLVGLGLIFGCLTGIAAFFGIFLNMSFMLAGASSTNPILATLALFLVLAWRVAGYYGLDFFVLPTLGTPWTGSLVFGKQRTTVDATPAHAA